MGVIEENKEISLCTICVGVMFEKEVEVLILEVIGRIILSLLILIGVDVVLEVDESQMIDEVCL